MANNCLKKSLKGTVNADLPIYGYAKVAMPINVGNRILANGGSYSNVYKVVDGTYNGQTEFTLSGAYLDTNKLVPTDQSKNYVTLLVPSYSTASIFCNFSSGDANRPAFDFDLFRYNSDNMELQLANNNIENADVFARIAEKIRFINLYPVFIYDGSVLDFTGIGKRGIFVGGYLAQGAAPVKGSLNDLGFSVSAFTQNVIFPASENVTFSIEQFVANARSTGVTQGECSRLKYVGSANATFNGSRIENTEDNPLSWTADTITFKGVTISA